MALYYRRRRIKILFFAVLPSIFLLITLHFFLQVTPVFINLSEDRVYSATLNIINDVISNILAKTDTKNLVEYKYDSTGNIVAVNANVTIMNKLNNAISKEISKELENLENIYIHLPLGSLISSNFLLGIGPTIPIKIIPLNNIHTEYSTEFSSTGINQTRHRIFINIECSVSVLSRLIKNQQTISVQIPIAETLIVGNVPSTYFDLKN